MKMKWIMAWLGQLPLHILLTGLNFFFFGVNITYYFLGKGTWANLLVASFCFLCGCLLIKDRLDKII